MLQQQTQLGNADSGQREFAIKVENVFFATTQTERQGIRAEAAKKKKGHNAVFGAAQGVLSARKRSSFSEASPLLDEKCLADSTFRETATKEISVTFNIQNHAHSSVKENAKRARTAQ